MTIADDIWGTGFPRNSVVGEDREVDSKGVCGVMTAADFSFVCGDVSPAIGIFKCGGDGGGVTAGASDGGGGDITAGGDGGRGGGDSTGGGGSGGGGGDGDVTASGGGGGLGLPLTINDGIGRDGVVTATEFDFVCGEVATKGETVVGCGFVRGNVTLGVDGFECGRVPTGFGTVSTGSIAGNVAGGVVTGDSSTSFVGTVRGLRFSADGSCVRTDAVMVGDTDFLVDCGKE